MGIQGTSLISVKLAWNSKSELAYAMVDGEMLQPPQPPQKAPGLTLLQWEALEKAEAKLYRNEHGYLGYTDVRERDSSSELVPWWDTAWIGCESVDLNWDNLGDNVRFARVAMRVAQAVALINFGPEFLLKSY